ncbi:MULTISPECIES: tetratricopeptide repeat protein [Flavobacterium]|uniref:Tetratricopeptide repeat protein n=1 Tax=Flavobacterium jumunjinense TaxID=998845 RepID=A0ABV5GRL4_9FLAO|nr:MULTISPECIES: tetratricopeptide repeat protein [Flavobacterium]
MSRFIKYFFLILLLTFSSQQTLFAQENPEDIALVDDEIEDEFYESLKQRAIENYDKAIVSIEKCILKSDKNPVFYHELGKNLLDLKRFPEAESAFRKAVDLNPKERWYWNGLYDVYYQSKDYQKSIPVVQKLITFDKNMKEDLVSLYMYTNQRDKALVLLKEMEKEMVLSKIMEIYKLRIQESSAYAKPEKKELEKAIEANPLVEQNYIDLMLLYSDSNQEEKAFDIAKKLAKEIPNSEWANVSLFKFYLVDKKGKEASESMFKVFKSHKIDMKIKQRMLNEFLIYVANTNTLNEELSKAIDYLQSDSKINTAKEVGKFFYNRKDMEKTVYYLEKGLKNDTEDFETLMLLMQSYISTQNHESLANLSEDYLELYPSQSILYFYAGLSNNKLTNYKKAIDYLETGLEFIIEDLELEKQVYIQLVESYKNIGNKKKEDYYGLKLQTLAKKNK